jgi:hypothetical protein
VDCPAILCHFDIDFSVSAQKIKLHLPSMEQNTQVTLFQLLTEGSITREAIKITGFYLSS